MMEQNENEKSQEKNDRVKISTDVIETLVGIAASEADEVASLSGSFTDGIAGVLGRKNARKGVKVEMEEDIVSAEVSIVIEYGCKIHEVAARIQDKVRETVETMTGMNVKNVVVNVIGINIKEEQRKVVEKIQEESEPVKLEGDEIG